MEIVHSAHTFHTEFRPYVSVKTRPIEYFPTVLSVAGPVRPMPITGEQLAEYQVGVWEEAGFGATEVRVTEDAKGGLMEPECTYVVCKDNYCERVKLKNGPTPAQIPDARFMSKLLMQPLSIAALVGMSVLMCCLDGTLPKFIAEPLLSLVGGKVYGTAILLLAFAAHALEGLYALHVCTSRPLNQPFWVALRYVWLVLLAGYPILRWVLKLRHVALQHEKRTAIEEEKKRRKKAELKQ